MANIDISEKLPINFQEKHRLLLYYNDIIVNILQLADEFKLESVEFQFKNKDDTKFADTKDPVEWLLKNGYEDLAHEVVGSHIFFSLLTDFIYYMHESFSCSERGKVSVAYAVSRKPFKDTLFHLCWLLARPEKYIDMLLHKETIDYDVTDRGMTPEFKELIYKEACSKISHKTIEFDATILYNIIYNKKSSSSLNGPWNMSNHIVTRDINYSTEKGSLNFVFSDEKIWYKYWEIYYDKIPYLMNFMMEVSITIFEKILSPNEETIQFNRSMRDLKLIMSNENQLKKIIHNEYLELLMFKCENCSKKFNAKEEIITDFLFTCPYCQSIERVGQYYIFNADSCN